MPRKKSVKCLRCKETIYSSNGEEVFCSCKDTSVWGGPEFLHAFSKTGNIYITRKQNEEMNSENRRSSHGKKRYHKKNSSSKGRDKK